MSTRQSDLLAAVRRAEWEPASIRKQAAEAETNPLFANLPAEVYATMRAGAEAEAQRIEAEGKAAEAELARRRARMSRITPGRMA